MRIRVFSPRTQAPILVDVAAGETVAALRGRVAQQLGGSANSVLLLAGQKLEDGDAAANILKNEEEVVFFMDVAAPPPPLPGFDDARAAAGRQRGGGRAGAGGPANNQAAALAASLMERIRQTAPQGAMGAQAPARASAAAAPGPARAAPTGGRAGGGGGGGSGGGGAAAAEQGVVQQLLEMGFSEVKARAAVRQAGLDLIDSVAWLSTYADESDAFFADKARAAPPAAAPAPSAAAPAPEPAVGPEVRQLATLFDPVFRAVAAAAHGDAGAREVLERERLPAMEAEGWKGFATAVRRVCAGEREHATLVRDLGLDPNTAFFLARVLETVALPPGQLAARADFNSRRALPRDLEFEGVLRTHDAVLRQLATVARALSAAALGEDSGAMVDDAEEQQAARIIEQMEAGGYQLRTGWELLCAGVRGEADLCESVGLTPAGVTDVNSQRVLAQLLAYVASP